MSTSYNGYTNYPTRCIKLWIDKDYSTKEYWMDRTADALHEDFPEESLRDYLYEKFTERANEMIDSACVFSDLLGYALKLTNFYEIAEILIEDFKDEYPNQYKEILFEKLEGIEEDEEEGE